MPNRRRPAPKKAPHKAQQFELPVEPPVTLSLTLKLTGETARRWRAYVATNADLNPSNGQMATALISHALAEADRPKQ